MYCKRRKCLTHETLVTLSASDIALTPTLAGSLVAAIVTYGTQRVTCTLCKEMVKMMMY